MTRVGYIVSRWGEPTQTFVRREAASLAEAGIEVSAYSLKRPHSESGLAVTWLGPSIVVRCALREFVQRPVRTARRFATVLRRSSVRNWPHQLVAVCVGLAWSRHGADPPDHLHCHFGWVSATACWAFGETAGRPFSVVLHAFELHTRRLVDSFTPVPLRSACQVFTISERDRLLVASRWGIEAEVLRMGVPREWLASAASAECDGSLLSVASLTPKKGHDVLLRSLSQMEMSARLTIIGEGPERLRLESLAADLGIQDRCSLPGHGDSDTVRQALHRTCVFVLASLETPEGDRDGIPVALMEAMAAGVPVVTTDAGAIPELVEGVGVVVPQADPSALARAIDDLLARPSERQRMAAAALERVREGWLAERGIQQILDAVNRCDHLA